MGTHAPAGVFSLDEVARAALVTQAQVRAVAGSDGPFAAAEAVRLGRALVASRRAGTEARSQPLFANAVTTHALLDARRAPLALSATLHAAVLTTLVFALGFHSSAAMHGVDDNGRSPHLI